MLEFPLFAALPGEIKLRIWLLAAEGAGAGRVIKLDAKFQLALAEPSGRAMERIIFGGNFWAQEAPGTGTSTCPPESPVIINTLSLVCVDSRKAILKAWPDVIGIEEPLPTIANEAMRMRNLPAPGGQRHGPIRRMMLRCNFDEDIFFLRDFRQRVHRIRHSMDYAKKVDEYWTRSGPGAANADAFRSDLKRIKHMVIEWLRPVGDGERVEPTIQYHLDRASSITTLLGGTPNLENLWVCTWGTQFNNIQHINKVPIGMGAWNEEFQESMPQEFKPDIKAVRAIYNRTAYRIVSPLCRTASVQDISAAGDTARNEAQDMEQGFRNLGFSTQIPPLRTLDVLPRTPQGASAQEAVWLPNPGYIVGPLS
ncbi:Fc.00g027100.m01.CDS01 [Cosmosporella sp. VM-42]